MVAVAVPLRGECQLLPQLVAALSAQKPGGWSGIRVHLLFDGIEDSDMPIVQGLAASHDESAPVSFTTHVIERGAQPNAGRARRQAVAYALADRRRPGPDIVLTTDGDTVPAPDWVSRAVRALGEVDVVAGHIERDRTSVSPARDALEAYLEALHTMRRTVDPIVYDPPPSHPWAGGANLGLHTEVYSRLGGFPAIACGEDKALVDEARLRGLKVRHARDVRVVTSSRLAGRIEGGLASALTHMAAERTEPLVEHPHDAARQYARHAWARRLRDEGTGTDTQWRRFAREVNGQADALKAMAGRLPNGEAFAMHAVPVRPTTRSLSLSRASRALAELDIDDVRLD